jgi:hypothetical protein
LFGTLLLSVQDIGPPDCGFSNHGVVLVKLLYREYMAACEVPTIHADKLNGACHDSTKMTQLT